MGVDLSNRRKEEITETELRTRDLKEIVRLAGELEKEESISANLRVKYGIPNTIIKDRGYSSYLFDYYKIIKYSDLIREEVRRHVVDGKTYEEVSQEFDTVNINSYRTMVYKETLRLREILVINPLNKVRAREEITESDYGVLNKLKELYPLVRGESKGNFGLDLDFSQGKFDRGIGEKISDEEFEVLIEILKSASHNYRRLSLKGVTPEYIGYVDYLLTKNKEDLTNDEKYRRGSLISELMLGVED